MKKEHLKTVRVRNPAFILFLLQKLHFLKNWIILIATTLTWMQWTKIQYFLLISLWLKVPILAKRVPSSGERSQVSSDHEEPGAEICHPGAEEGGERGRHGGWRQWDQERHLRLQVRDDRDHEGVWDEHPGCLWRIRLALRNCLYSGETHFHFSPGPGGKKNRQKERRLMKGFHLATGGSAGSGGPDSNLQIKFSGAWWPFNIYNIVQILSNYILNNFITLLTRLNSTRFHSNRWHAAIHRLWCCDWYEPKVPGDWLREVCKTCHH